MPKLSPPPQSEFDKNGWSHHVDWLFRLYKYITSFVPQNTASAIPTTGTWALGSILWNSAPTAGGYIGWVCITAGSPGTWKGFGLIQA